MQLRSNNRPEYSSVTTGTTGVFTPARIPYRLTPEAGFPNIIGGAEKTAPGPFSGTAAASPTAVSVPDLVESTAFEISRTKLYLPYYSAPGALAFSSEQVEGLS
jgi:hypothetical protein